MAYKQTSWVKNSREATGQDQLGLRFFSESIYQELLPNITNVTSRGRYYSFYPWLIWSVENRANDLKGYSLQKIVRRADCLLTLIGLYHHYISDDSISSLHDGLVGAKKLSSVLTEMLESKKSVQISKYAAIEESPDRYFKNKFGGLGQYYFGPLRDAGILAYNEKNEIHYTEDRGLIIAESFDKSVNGGEFFEVLINDSVSEINLANLLDFCPCRLAENPAEQNTLLDFLFSRIEIFQNSVWGMRKKTLTLLLDFIEKCETFGSEMKIDSSGVHKFLGSVYAGAFNKQISWDSEIKESLETKILWRQYYSGELLSFAVQTLFWAGLTTFTREERIILNTKDYGYWFAETFSSSLSDSASQNFSQMVEEIAVYLPEIEDQENLTHEISLTRQLEQAVKDKGETDRKQKTVALAIKVLLTLAARFENDSLDFPVSFSNQQLNEYPINLTNFINFSKNEWQAMNLNEWLAWLAVKWGVETHLMIALRKLHYESLNTFKIYPSEEGLQVKEFSGDKTIEEILLPNFTSPRLRTTFQILWDLGLITSENESFVLTTVGKSILEEIGNG